VTLRWDVSPWLTEVEDPAPRLDHDVDVDVAVVGAGFTGLSSALALAGEGLSVAVVERRIAGFGASGRNAGHLTPTIGKDLPTLARMFGAERTRALLAFAEEAVAHTERLIARHAIECDYEPVGNVLAAVHERQFAMIDRAARAAATYGAAGELLEPARMRERGLPDVFLRGFLEPKGGVLNPACYLRGLRRAALAAGVLLFENTPVVRIAAQRRPVVHTEGGRVRARSVVHATNATSRTLGVRGPGVARLRVQLFRTEPLSDAQVAAIPWRERQGVYTAHEILESYRLTADNRIVGGSKFIRYGFNNRELPDTDGDVCGRLEAVFRRRFPGLAEVRITDHWGGPIGFSLDFLPQVGRTGPHGNVLYSVGYCGHGVAQASYAGRMMVDLLLERDGPGAALWSRRTVPLPPEPLRWLVAHALKGVFEWMDRRVDREPGSS
jgi:gamma-glutamylputrescine oxidase